MKHRTSYIFPKLYYIILYYLLFYIISWLNYSKLYIQWTNILSWVFKKLFTQNFQKIMVPKRFSIDVFGFKSKHAFMKYPFAFINLKREKKNLVPFFFTLWNINFSWNFFSSLSYHTRVLLNQLKGWTNSLFSRWKGKLFF